MPFLWRASEKDLHKLLLGGCIEGARIDPDDYFMDYQDDWINDLSPAKVWDKSRRIGATYAESYAACRLRNKLTEKRHYYFSSADESAAFEFALYCRQWCKMFDAVVREVTEEMEDSNGRKYNNYVVEFSTGSRINCMSSNPKRFRSKGGDVTLDEFDWHENPSDMFDAASPATTWGFNIALLSTRSSEGTPFDVIAQLCDKVEKGLTTFDKERTLNWKYYRTSIVTAIQQGLAEKIFKQGKVSFAARCRFFYRDTSRGYPCRY